MLLLINKPGIHSNGQRGLVAFCTTGVATYGFYISSSAYTQVCRPRGTPHLLHTACSRAGFSTLILRAAQHATGFMVKLLSFSHSEAYSHRKGSFDGHTHCIRESGANATSLYIWTAMALFGAKVGSKIGVIPPSPMGEPLVASGTDRKRNGKLPIKVEHDNNVKPIR
jgi:hypothetical protein